MINNLKDAFSIVLDEDFENPDRTSHFQDMGDDQQSRRDIENSGDTDSDDAFLDRIGASNDSKGVMAAAMSAEKQMEGSLKKWIEQIDDFTEFLNGTNEGSLQTHIKDSAPGTIFDRINRAEAKKIARAAMELSALAEILKGYLATSHDPKYRFV